MDIDHNYFERFETRHISPNDEEIKEMLEFCGLESLEELIHQTIPENIRIDNQLNLPTAVSEHQFLNDFMKLAAKNKVFKSYIGMGYYSCIVPPVILRNILENPGWYTAYTPYQAEIAQGRLEALVNFQNMVMDLTGLELANASLLDEGTAAAEAMSMFASFRKGSRKNANKFLVDEHIFPQTLNILKTRAKPIEVELVIKSIELTDLDDQEVFGMILQYPNNNGEAIDHSTLINTAKEAGIYSVLASDLMALVLLKAPGEMGADAVVGSSQRFGVPKGYGGPHAAFLAAREDFKRHMPGRIIGVSVDRHGDPAYRMALQTREQHIKRERATSNICTAQVLLAVMAGMYAVYHGPDGLKKIALRIHGLAQMLEEGLRAMGIENLNRNYFDTLKLKSGLSSDQIKISAEKASMNFRYFEDGAVGISLDETTTHNDIMDILGVFAGAGGTAINTEQLKEFKPQIKWDESLIRTTDYLTHPVYHKYRSEHEMLRYLKRLENKDLSLAHSMISLGSCTMKLNATSEMIPVSWGNMVDLHPFAPAEQAEGYGQMFSAMEEWLKEITGLAGVSLQPNSGAQGEFAGLMVIKAYHKDRGEDHRNITLIPSSAHGTNPASAIMAGTRVVIVACDDHGNIDLDDLKEKAEAHKENLAALMVTYPSTHGVFEEEITTICDIIHDNGGLVYMDGANMNAQVGLTSPGKIGADVCHINLHKTFCIPHGGGGPGMGPIAVAEHLVPFLPGNPVIETGGEKAITAISAAPWGSAGIISISYAYIAMMGVKGLTRATQIAILNANYMKDRLKDHFPILYTGKNGRAAHEFIVDCRDFRHHGIEVEDIAKRLMDYGFHAPTVSFPVPGTMMIEPTESETKAELDRFCEALIEIRNEIREVENGVYPQDSNVLKNAPHTQTDVLVDSWDYPYSREKAVYPLPWLKANKFWPSVARIDNAYGDRNLFCACVPTDFYQEESLAT